MRKLILLTVAAVLFCSTASAQAQVATSANGQPSGPDAWRYQLHNNQWWYYTPQEQWMYHDGNNWNAHNPAAVNPNGGNSRYYQGNANNQNRYQSGYRGYYNGNNGYYNNGYGSNYNNYGYGGNVGSAILGRVLGGRW